MSFPAEKTGGRIEPDPTRSRNIDFGPGMQVSEVLGSARWTVERLKVRTQLNEIARDKTGCEAEMAEDLHHQPRAVATRAGAKLESLLRGLHAGIHPDQIASILLQTLVERHNEVHGVLRRARDRGDKFAQQRPGRLLAEIGSKLLVKLARVLERILHRGRIDEKIERIDDRHVGEKIDRDGELPRALGKDEAGKPVAVRILLPVHEVLGRRHLE